MRQLVWTLERSGTRRLAFIEDFGVNGVELLILGDDGREISRERFVTMTLAEQRAATEHGRLLAHGWAESNAAP